MITKTPLFPANRIAILSRGETVREALALFPFLRDLRAAWPTATLHWITSHRPSAFNDSLRATAQLYIHEIHERPSWLISSFGQTAVEPFDLLIDIRKSGPMALGAKWNIPHKLFIAPAWHYFFSDQKPNNSNTPEKLLEPIHLVAGFMPEISGRLPVCPDLLEKARRILPEGQLYVGFSPSTERKSAAWPLDHFEKVAQLQVRMNRIPVFFLEAQDIGLYNSLFRAIPEAIFPLQAHEVWGTKETKADHILALTPYLELAVTHETPMRAMMAAMDCPLITLKPNEKHKVLNPKPLETFLSPEDFGGMDMASISVESVQETINRAILLQKRL